MTLFAGLPDRDELPLFCAMFQVLFSESALAIVENGLKAMNAQRGVHHRNQERASADQDLLARLLVDVIPIADAQLRRDRYALGCEVGVLCDGLGSLVERERALRGVRLVDLNLCLAPLGTRLSDGPQFAALIGR